MPKASWFEPARAIAIADSATESAGFTLNTQTVFVGALFHAMDNGDIGLAFSIDGTNFNPVIDILTGVDAVIVASGADPGWVDFSDLVRFVPNNDKYQLRFTCASQTSGAVDVTLIEKG